MIAKRRLDILPRQQMSELVTLRIEIRAIMVGRSNLNRLAPGNLQSIAFETDDLAWIIREQADGRKPDVEQNLRADSVIPQVRLEPEARVRFDCILSRV